MTPDHDAYAALRHPNFRLFAISRFAASMGSLMESVAVGWQIYERTHMPIALGLIGLVDAVPALSVGLWGGYIADRSDRRLILIFARVALAFCSFALMAVTLANFWLPYSIYAILFFVGIASGLQGPAAQALMPELVPPRDFANSVTWRTTIFQFSSLIGPAAGGFLLGWHRNPAHVYAVDGTLGLFALGALMRMRHVPERPAPSGETVWTNLTDGVRFVWRRRVILGAITLDLFAVLFGGAVALLPIYARDILHAGPQGLGILRASPSLGAIGMALLQVHRPPIRRTGAVLFTTVAIFGLAMIGFGVSTSLPVSIAFLALSGAADTVSMVIRGTVVQAMTPNLMRGRVSAVNGIFVGTSNEIGGFESGLVAQWLGTVSSVVLGGMMTVVVVAAIAWRWPELRDLGPLDELDSG